MIPSEIHVAPPLDLFRVIMVLMSEKQRYSLRPVIEAEAVAWAIGVVTAEEIDRMNILKASIVAMTRAINALKVKPEYLIIDGASKDNTVAIARQLEPDFRGRLRIYSEPDDGLYYAMNKGLHLAKGDFVWFMNAGDQIFAPETLQQIADQIKPDVDIVYGKASIVNAQGVKVSEHHKKTPEHLTRRSLLNGRGFLRAAAGAEDCDG